MEPATKRSWNWPVWAGFVLVLVGLFSFIPVFAHFPVTRVLVTNRQLRVAGFPASYFPVPRPRRPRGRDQRRRARGQPPPPGQARPRLPHLGRSQGRGDPPLRPLPPRRRARRHRHLPPR